MSNAVLDDTGHCPHCDELKRALDLAREQSQQQQQVHDVATAWSHFLQTAHGLLQRAYAPAGSNNAYDYDPRIIRAIEQMELAVRALSGSR